MAAQSDNSRATQYQLHDSGIWGTRTGDPTSPVGRLNYAIQAVDMAPPVDVTKLAQPDVVQDDANVVIYSTTENTIAQVAVAQASVQPPQSMPPGSRVQMGGDRGAVFAPGTGSLWVTAASSLGTQSYSGEAAAKPLLRLGHSSALAVGTDGTTYAYDPSSGVLDTIAGTHVSTKRLAAISTDSSPDMTAVGNHAVVLDAANHRLLVSTGKTITLPADLADQPTLQQPGDDGGHVLVESAQALATVSLTDGQVDRLPISDSYGAPVAPVALGGCDYGAWQAHGNFVRVCDAKSTSGVLDQRSTTALTGLTWRVNRGRVALNNAVNGAWVTFDPVKVLGANAWLTAFGVPQKSKSNDPNGTVTGPQCKDTKGPETRGFDAGVRSGASVVIPVMRHVVDPSGCHVLAIVDAHADGSVSGSVAIVDEGRSLLFAPAGNHDSALLTYTVSDGSREATGTVTVHVYGPGDETPPETAPDTAKVQAGHSVTYNVLANDTDREGDPLRLLEAHIEGAAANRQPSIRADGDVTVSSTLQDQSGQHIHVVYSATDDRPGGLPKQGVLDVTVQSGVVPPTAASDFGATSLNARTATGARELAVDLLANDTVGSGGSLSLVSVNPIPNQRLRFVADGQMFFTPTVVGDFSTTYVVSDGTSTSTGRVRIRVTKGGPNHPPVAVPDRAQMRAAGTSSVNVLDNDTDADADVLFVAGVSVDPSVADKVRVAIVAHAQLKITATTNLDAPLSFGYTVTDGMDTDQGLVTVLPSTAVSGQQAPVARDDEATVRANGAAEIPVLANDFDPNGGVVTLDTKVPFTTLDGAVQLDPIKQGLLYAHGNTLRFSAPAIPAVVRVNYNVTNGYATSTGQLTINVIADDKDNQPPDPPPLVTRVFAGSSTPLTIPLLGVDPENDPVTLVGLGTPPSRGVISSLNGAKLEYRADPADQGQGGTDMFTYWLRDDHGGLGEGTVLVAVAPPPLLNTPPVPEDDAIRARPGTKIRVAVTANDVDADGDPVSVATGADGPTTPTNAPKPVVVDSGTIEVTVPQLPDDSQVVFFYAVTDGINPVSSQRGEVIVTVTHNAVDLPTAVDDVVPGTRAPDPNATVTVPVLANDSDPTYDRNQLTIKPAFNHGYAIVGNEIRIPIGTQSRLVSYCIQNPEGSSACAFVQLTVGNPKSAPPVAIADFASTTVGHPVSLDVTANDQHAPGTTLRVSRIVAAHDGTAKVTEGRIVAFTPYPTAPGYGEVVYQVTDGTQTSEGIFFVTVKGNQPPRLEGSAISLSPGNHVDVALAPYLLDTAASTASRDQFQVLSQQLPSGIRAPVSGGRIRVSASESAIGQTGSVTLRAGNGRVWSRAALFQITVTQPPVPQATNFDIGPFKQGSGSHSIDVLAHATDPVGKGLRIVTASVDGGAGTVQWDQGFGGQLRYLPSARFSGQTQILVTIGDKTGKADRQTVARITVAVYGPPTSPHVAPSVSAATDPSTNAAYFTLDWSNGPAQAEGAAIDHYEINWSGGNASDHTCAGSGTRCGVSGLAFDRPYIFKVRAVDIYHDDGEWGPASKSQQYDIAPPPVSDAGATFDLTSSTSIDLSWTAPTGYKGSPIEFYDVYLGSNLASSVPAPAVGTPIRNLATGQAYQFTIRTRNRSGQRSDAVMTSPPVRPLAVPTAVPTPAVSESLNVNDSVDVQWPTPSSPSDVAHTGGDDPANLQYFVSIDNGAAVPASGPGFFNFPNPVQGHAYDIRLGVTNSLVAKTCQSQLASCARFLSASVSFTTYGPPSEATNMVATASASQQLSLTFHPGALAPNSPADLQSQVYLTAVSPAIAGVDVSQPMPISSGWATPANLSAGQSYSFTLLTCAVPSNTPSRRFCETNAQSVSATPFGPPGQPSQPGGSVNARTITWNWGAPNDGCGGCGESYVLSGYGNVGGTQQPVGYPSYSTTYCVTVHAVNGKGVAGPESSQGCRITGPAPAPPTHMESPWYSGGATTWLRTNASGQGPRVTANTWVQVTCRKYDATVSTGLPDGYWYLLTNWNGQSNTYWSPANSYYNGGSSGSNPGRIYTDTSVPIC